MDIKEMSEDKKGIEMEERENILNSESKVEDFVVKSDDVPILEVETRPKIKSDCKEGREVQPKKIPIGGIQMPGFFTRSKSKEKVKQEENEQQENTTSTEMNETKGKENKEETKNSYNTKIKLPNPFRKSLAAADEAAKASEIKEKKRLLDSIRLPLASAFPRKKKEAGQNLQSQVASAGLASMETLDENDKSADKREDDLKEVSLNVNIDEKKELEKCTSSDYESTWNYKLRSYRVVISAFLVFILLVIIIIIVSLPGPQIHTVAIRDGRFVQTATSCGPVEGLVEDGAVAFRGIPYARQPVSELRFKSARPLDSIEYCWNGTYFAHNATDYCLQLYGNGTMVGVEDCLTLDVVTPHIRYDSPLPVVVLIGSESLIGGSPGKMRPSARYARSRDVIFVRPNFRLGVLGFLAADVLKHAVHPPTSGNYGLSDIVEALKWIQLNIEHFGGDRNAVTLFGHRAGATLVTALTTIPGANKLFARAWATSGAAIFPNKTLIESEAENRDYISTIPCNDIHCLQQTDAEFLTNSIADTWRKPETDLPERTEEPDKRHNWLVLDGNILKDHPGKMWASEEGVPVQLVLGTTAHAAANEMLHYKYKEWSEDLVKQHIKESKLGQMNLTEEIFKMYPATYQGLIAMITDIRIVCPLLAISNQMRNVALYIATQIRGELHLSDIDSDVDAILGRYEPKTVDQKRYISTIQQFFYHYVSHGTLPRMSSYSKQLFKLEQDFEYIENYNHCDFWIKKDIVPQYAIID